MCETTAPPEAYHFRNTLHVNFSIAMIDASLHRWASMATFCPGSWFNKPYKHRLLLEPINVSVLAVAVNIWDIKYMYATITRA